MSNKLFDKKGFTDKGFAEYGKLRAEGFSKPEAISALKDEEYSQKVKVDCLKEKNKMRTRYYFWDWCYSYGWRQMGYGSGYSSIKELRKDCAFSIGESDNWKILKAEVIEGKKIA